MVVWLLTAAFLLVAVFCIWRDTLWDGTVGISALIPTQTGEEEVRCWERKDEEYYLFLPGYAQLELVKLKTGVSNTVYLNGEKMEPEMTGEGLQWDVAYDLCYMSKGKEHHYSLTFLRSQNVPALYIDTASGSMEHIHAVKGNEEPGTFRLYTAEGELNHGGILDTIKGRGNSTWDYEKKPYNLTLSTEADLLGMGAAKRWILLANAADPSNLKNKLAYDLARDAGLAYSPESRWVELFLNGEYAGLYLLSERNEVHTQRVDLTGEGSFLVSKDWDWRFRKTGDPFVMTQDNTALRIYYSDLSEDALLARFQSVENAIFAEDGVDPVTGKHWQELIDLDSWGMRYLVEEALGNVDASTLSQFFYLDGADPSGKICAGPVWDMDLILRSSSEEWLQGVNQFYGNRPHVYGSHWMYELYHDELFYEHITEQYREKLEPLLIQLLEQGIEEAFRQIRQAANLNAIRWRLEPPQQARQTMERVLKERLDFLHKIWVQEEAYVTVTVIDIADNIRNIVIPEGTCIPALPEYESDETVNIRGWVEYPSYEPFDVSQPIFADVSIAIWHSAVEDSEGAE